ncbi:hypothetical protein [Arthrobacter rhizosphaerae]|uniref:hypothetical protein n=1 Tax=Arthrobacter rhizosphaerae TaxID=2855490 RepID=UPI001FF47C3C|nr:hypothetical protein [Arthrobacter rhizosphaerae]
MANLLDRVMKKIMRRIDLEPNKSDRETRMNAKAAGPFTTRGTKYRGRSGHRAGTGRPHKAGRWTNMLHREH